MLKSSLPFSETWGYRLFVQGAVPPPEVSAELDKVDKFTSVKGALRVKSQVFTMYADLPMELKIKIWEFAIPHLPGRIVTILTDSSE